MQTLRTPDERFHDLPDYPSNPTTWILKASGYITLTRAAEKSFFAYTENPPGFITVVGAAKGASIAVAVSYLVGNRDVNYIMLATCHPTVVDDWLQQRIKLSGNVLAIYDYADDEYSGSCEALFDVTEGHGLSRHEEIVLQVGTEHGILYDPLPGWALPTIRWAHQQW